MIWSIRDGKGNWQGPLTLEEVIVLPYFSLRIWMRNLQENVQAPAREFPQLQLALRSLYQKKHINPRRRNKCPRCRVELRDSFYEGVSVKACPECGGKLVDAALTDRIVARREVDFSCRIPPGPGRSP
jgi:ribosomal protein S27AE